MEQGEEDEQFMIAMNSRYPTKNYQLKFSNPQRKNNNSIRDFMSFLMSLSLRGKSEEQIENRILKEYPTHSVNVILLDDEGEAFEIDIIGPRIVASLIYEDVIR